MGRLSFNVVAKEKNAAAVSRLATQSRNSEPCLKLTSPIAQLNLLSEFPVVRSIFLFASHMRKEKLCAQLFRRQPITRVYLV